MVLDSPYVRNKLRAVAESAVDFIIDCEAQGIMVEPDRAVSVVVMLSKDKEMQDIWCLLDAKVKESTYKLVITRCEQAGFGGFSPSLA